MMALPRGAGNHRAVAAASLTVREFIAKRTAAYGGPLHDLRLGEPVAVGFTNDSLAATRSRPHIRRAKC